MIVLGIMLWPVQPARAFSFQVQNAGALAVMSNYNVMVQYDLTNGNAAFYWQNQKVISAFYSGAGLGSGYIKGTNYANWTYAQTSSNQVVITATGKGHPAMKQYFTFDQTNSFLIRLEMDGTNLSANWLGPVVVDGTGAVDIGSYGDDRALFVPFDNDHFISYNAMSINSSSTSYEVGAFYDNVTRNGLVVGSVTHDTWKSGVYWNGSGNKLNQMNVFGGAVSSSVTWDVMPHGSVYGNSISSPTVFVGFGPDWRSVIESYADENTLMAPKRTWSNGVPFGWNSWGVIQTGINYTDATNASAFIKNNLQSNHFNNNGVVYINLDSYWDNLSSAQVQSFVNYCHANGQKAGLYLAPYAWFNTPAAASNVTVEGSSYTYAQIALRTSGGGFETNDGAIALDPTHPGTQQRVNYYLNEFTNWGIDYLKLDFLTHAALEGVHYNTNITTGIEAYNFGMQYICNQIGTQMFISESIAPLFPYQYGHARRIACDAYTSEISNTEYTLNSVSYGWWLDHVYCFNDPDIMVFEGLTTNENQSRLISAALTGVFLDGDSFTNAASDSIAMACLTNAAIDALARTGQTFVPVEGNTGTSASMVYTSQQGANAYLAVFNFSNDASVTNVDLSRAGISGAASAVDLWSGAVLPVTGANLTVALAPAQGRLFSFVNAPVLQSAQKLGNGRFVFTLSGTPGFAYEIQNSTDLVHWNFQQLVTNQSGTVPVPIAPAGNATAVFYRAVLQP